MWRSKASLAAAVLIASAASASTWNEKTFLTFSEPVMVPGATLPAGSYVFQLMDARSGRQIVQVTSRDSSELMALFQAVPIKRTDTTGDTIVKFNPTDVGSPPAMKAWFYTGSMHGHEFVYPEEEAKKIAERAKTVVLSIDVPGTDLEKGTLRTYDASGKSALWRGDPATMREWDEWQRNRPTSQAKAPMIEGDFQATRVELDELEENTKNYLGKTVSVDAAIEEVFGPRLFTIDEPNWGDLDGEILVHLPTTLAALVRENDRVTVTGTIKPFVQAELEREWGWMELDPDTEIELSQKPVMVATEIIGGNNNVAMVLDADHPSSKPVGTRSPLSDLGTIAKGDEELVGRQVRVREAEVESMAKGGGFFVKTENGSLFVLPSVEGKGDVSVGDSVSIDGVVLQTPHDMESRIDAPSGSNDDIYIYVPNRRAVADETEP